ncbi:hypothetical protein DICA4_D22694 [Diutina catenulata]
MSFAIQLIQKTLEDMGYGAISAQLQEQVNSHLAPAPEVDATALATIDSVLAQLAANQYDAVASFLTTQLNGPESALANLNVPTSDPGLAAMVVLYLVQRWQFLYTVLSPTASTSRDQLMAYIESTLMDTLDGIQASVDVLLAHAPRHGAANGPADTKPQVPLWDIFDRNLLLNLTAEVESKLMVSLVLDWPYTPAQAAAVLAQPRYLFGYTGTVASPNGLAAVLCDTFLARVWRHPVPPQAYDIPSGYLDKVVAAAAAYTAQQNVFHLPPRTLLEAKASAGPAADLPLPTAVAETSAATMPLRLLYDLRMPSNNQVWCCKFSPSGRWLLSGSRDGKLALYDVANDFKLVKVLESSKAMDEQAFCVRDPQTRPVTGKQRSVSLCCWDPTEQYVVGCYLDNVVRVWSVARLHDAPRRVTRSTDTPEFKLVSCFTLSDSENATISANAVAFLGPERFVIGSESKALRVYNVFGEELFNFYANVDDDAMDMDDEDSRPFARKLKHVLARINSVAVTPDGKFVVTTDKQAKIQIFAVPASFGADATTYVAYSLSAPAKTDACTISENGERCLVNVGTDELCMYNIAPRRHDEDNPHEITVPYLERKFCGLSCGKYTLRASFGYHVEPTGQDELVVCGSDDGSIFVWKAQTGQLITRLQAHDGPCNMVDWNTNGFVRSGASGVRDYGKLWCSVGDDGFVKVWGPSDWK